MASNPIKRRAKQSFLIGFLLALAIMAGVVFLLFTKINSLNEENAKLKIVGPKLNVYTVVKDIEEGEAITVDDLQSATIQLSSQSATLDVANYIDPSIFYSVNEETGEEVTNTYKTKVKIQAGTVVTLSMLQQGEINNDERLMEYGMVVLPSQLVNGDYIDVRLRLANGTETVVLSKKKVQQCTEKSIWLKMTEEEILTMNSAIVDAYIAKGSQLRATVYTDPLMQAAAEQTYPVNDEILTLITYNPNILVSARNALLQKWSVTTNPDSGVSDFRAKRRDIDSYIIDTQEEKAENIEEAYGQEATDISTARSEFVSELEGTGMVGTTQGN